MYVPPAFRETDLQTIQALITSHSFGILVTSTHRAPFATHLPFLLDAGRGDYGTLRGHVARANPQWQGFTEAQEALVIFQGPHAYISPTWYKTAPSVPTWNYVAVHAYGQPRVLEDEAALRELLRDLIEQHERSLPQPWSMDQLPEDYLRGMTRAIVGFEIVITRLEAKRKLSQNRSTEDQIGAAAGLETLSDELAGAIASLMRG